MPPALHGRIFHRLNLPKSSSDVPVSKKNRPITKHDDTLSENRIHYFSCGFIFIHNNHDESSPCNKEYLLSLPRDLLKIACDAIRSERDVIIRRYTAIALLESPETTMLITTEKKSTIYDNDNVSPLSSSSSTTHYMIEIHEKGLEVLPPSHQEDSPVPQQQNQFLNNASNSSNSDKTNGQRYDPERNNLWTLTQFWRKERIDFQSMKNSRPEFSIIATVDAISPIVAMDPSNPFALIEAYDRDNLDICCVIVLHGGAMLNHAAIFPLDTLVFRDVVYRPWSIPQILTDDEQKISSSSSIDYRHLIGRIPSHVFVATKVDSVSWHHHHQFNADGQKEYLPTNFISQKKHTKKQKQDQPENNMLPIITPVNLMTMVQGRIYHVETLCMRTATVIHYIDMVILSTNQLNDDDDDDDSEFVGGISLVPKLRLSKNTVSSDRLRCRLYLSHFPMSLDIQFSLRRGAVIQANNIHLVHFHNGQVVPSSNVDINIELSYGACLRSTLVLLKTAANASENESEDEFEEVHESTKSALKGDRILGNSLSTRASNKSTMQLQTQSTVLCTKRHKGQQNGMNEFDDDGKNQKNGTSSDIDCTRRSIDRLLPFLKHGFRRIDQTYLEDIYYKQVVDWIHRCFRGTLREKNDNGLLEEFIVNALLKCNLNNERGDQNKTKIRCNHEVNPSATVVKNRRRHPLRSPYAEFFDHPFRFNSPQDDGCGNMYDVLCGCHLSVEDRKYSSLSTSLLLDLDGIRIASQHYFERQTMKLLSSSPSPSKIQTLGPLNQLKTGFSGSIRVPLRELCCKNSRENKGNKEPENKGNKEPEDNQDTKENQKYGCFAGGFVSELHTASSNGVSSIVDGGCQIPISFDHKRGEHAGIDDFIIGRIDFAMISCLCIGSLSTKKFAENNSNNPLSCLQSFISKASPFPVFSKGKKQLMGNCSLVTFAGLLFVTAVQIHFRDYKVFKATDSLPNDQGGMRREENIVSVEDCLINQDFHSKSIKTATLMGMLTRCRFHYKVNMDGTFKCCNIVISSSRMNESKDLESDNSCLQALELSLSVVQNTARMIKFNQTLDNLLPGENLSQSQKVLGLSFWVLGDSGRTCALTFGGSEDIIQDSTCSKSIINVHLPSSSLELTELGYVRSLCTTDRLDVSFTNHRRVDEEQQPREFLTNSSLCLFDFVGGMKVMSGTLHRRPSRRNIFGHGPSSLFRAVGELSMEPSTAIPVCTLSNLFELVYRCLREPGTTQKIMNPSLVRRISHGRFLTVSFCQVQCYCMRCLCPLVESTTSTKEEATNIGKRKRKEVFDEPSFWHLPHPDEHLDGIDRTKICYSSVLDNHVSDHIQKSSLQCPKNDCSKNTFGVKWECSGILDDGTGQATMYADGDAALTLLGISAENIQIIEDGVWSTRDGSFLFMKSIPPSNDLQQKLIQVLSARKRNNNTKFQIYDPIRLLSMKDRALYLLERHCRSSSRPRRLLDYYVRCKPLVTGTKIPHMHHCKIDTFFVDHGSYCNGGCTVFRGQVASYTLPPLKLELVDCGVHSL